MPLYEFFCKKCSTLVESIVPFDKKTEPCPHCKSKMERKFPTPAHMKEVFGKTKADSSIRSKMKDNPMPAGGAARFDDGKGNHW